MTHVFTLPPFIYIAHVPHVSTTISITLGVPNSLHSNVRKYTIKLTALSARTYYSIKVYKNNH